MTKDVDEQVLYVTVLFCVSVWYQMLSNEYCWFTMAYV